MRTLVGLLTGLIILAVAGTALAGQAATNSNGDFVDLAVKVTPPISGTAQAPRGVGLNFDSFAGNRINANSTGTNNSLNVHSPRISPTTVCCSRVAPSIPRR